MNEPVKSNHAVSDAQRRLADTARMLELFGNLPSLRDEGKIIAKLQDLLTAICAPRHVVYVPIANGRLGAPRHAPAGWQPSPTLREFSADEQKADAPSASGQGFLLRIRRGAETLGVMEIEGVKVPQDLAHYRQMALAMVNTCDLALQNVHAGRELAQLNKKLNLCLAQGEAATKELEAFNYSISHDLRAPLHGITGWSRVLAEDYGSELDPQAKAALDMIRAETERMSQMIKALLQLSRISRTELRPEPVDLSAMVRALEQELRGTEPDRQVDVIIAPGVMTQGDPMLLRVVLQHLMGNAWKFTRRCVRPRIEFGLLPQADKRVFFIRDNGAGFDPAYAAKLFTPFQRLHTPEEFPGMGMGLATVQRIMRRHGGAVWAEGAVDRGATFYFSLSETAAPPG